MTTGRIVLAIGLLGEGRTFRSRNTWVQDVSHLLSEQSVSSFNVRGRLTLSQVWKQPTFTTSQRVVTLSP